MHRRLFLSSLPIVLAANVHTAAVAETLGEVAADLNVSPESLIVAQAADKAELCIARLAEASDLRAQLTNSREIAKALEDQLTALDEAIAIASESPTLMVERSSLQLAYENANSSVKSARESLREFVLQDLDGAQRLRMDRWQQSLEYDVPSCIRAQQYSAAEWQLIEVALRAQTRAATNGEELSAGHQELLEAVFESSEVELASAQLTLLLPSMTQSFASPL